MKEVWIAGAMTALPIVMTMLREDWLKEKGMARLGLFFYCCSIAMVLSWFAVGMAIADASDRNGK